MTSVAHEQEALPIRIPLLKGLLGYRVMVVRRADEQKIAAIENLSELKALTAVQGFGWVDVQILEANHFKVEASAWYQSIYKSLAAGYYDYYPRSILEAWSELDQRPNPALVIDKKHLLYYPTAIYFFVNKNNGKLAERLSYGL